jgi:hypothetical protein
LKGVVYVIQTEENIMTEFEILMERWRRCVAEDLEGEMPEVSGLILSNEDEEEDEEEDELEEWNREDDKSYPSRQQRKRNKYALKPDRSSWTAGADELVNGGLSKGFVGMSEAKKKRPHCHPGNPYRDQQGRFTDPEADKGSYSVPDPDGGSPANCQHGQRRRSRPTRSTQATQRPCGRKGRFRCKDGSRKYEEQLQRLQTLHEGDRQQFEAYLSGVISRELQRAIKMHMKQTGCSFNQLVRAMDIWSRAEKGTATKNAEK